MLLQAMVKSCSIYGIVLSGSLQISLFLFFLTLNTRSEIEDQFTSPFI